LGRPCRHRCRRRRLLPGSCRALTVFPRGRGPSRRKLAGSFHRFGGCSSPINQPVAFSVFIGSGRSQSKHWNVRCPSPPGGSARIKNAPQCGHVGRSAWPIRQFAAGSQISSIQKRPIPKINRRGGLLVLLRMKCRFLRVQICDQGLNPFNRDLIANRQEHSPVMLDLFVELDASVAHGGIRSSRVPRQPVWMPVGKDGWTGDLFNRAFSQSKSTMVPMRNQTGRSLR
jgi:hypothetical protein